MSDHNAEPVSRTDCTPWRDEQTVRHFYVDKRYSLENTGGVLGCAGCTVLQWCKRHGIETRDPGQKRRENAPKELRDGDRLRELYHDEGMTAYEIADRVGFTPKGVHNWIERHGIETRPSHGLGNEDVVVVCANCDGEFEVSVGSVDRAKYCSRGCYYEDMEMPTGSDHWSYRENPNHRPAGKEWQDLRDRIRKRDGYECRLCGTAEPDMSRELDVHHLDRVRDADDPRHAVELDDSRLVALCRSCHRRVERFAPLIPPSLE